MKIYVVFFYISSGCYEAPAELEAAYYTEEKANAACERLKKDANISSAYWECLELK